MAKPIIDDELRVWIEPLLPPARPRCFRYPGRQTCSRAGSLTGILFVLKSGIHWSDLPESLRGCKDVFVEIEDSRLDELGSMFRGVGFEMVAKHQVQKYESLWNCIFAR